MAGFKDWVFNKSPLWLKGGLLGVYSWKHSSTKYGPIYRDEVARLREYIQLDSASLEKTQYRLLSEFLIKVRGNNPYYRAMMDQKGVDAVVIERYPVAALLGLDILEKSFLKENANQLTAPNVGIAMIASTSGTSGSPMETPYDIGGYQKGFAYWRRFYDGLGLSESFRNARFSGRVLLGRDQSPRVFWVHDWFENRLFFSTYHMSEKNLSVYVNKLNRYRPHLIDGYPSALAILARYIESSGISLDFKPVAAATTAETLSDADRIVIERAFGCKVYNQYASSEGAPFITECNQGRMHLNTDTGYFEFHDIADDSDMKELVVTSFRNLKLPLIRYRIGDTVRLNGADKVACACGSHFPTISSIEGRMDDLLYSSERGVIGRLDPIYKGVQGIKRSQIIQEGIDDFRILIEPSEEFDALTTEILDLNFRNRVGFSVLLNIDVVAKIPLAANGKFRAVVNRISTCQNLKKS